MWTNLNALDTTMHCAKLWWNSTEEFLISSMFFSFFVIISLDKLEFPFPKNICGKFGWNRLSGSGVEDENVTSLQTDR